METIWAADGNLLFAVILIIPFVVIFGLWYQHKFPAADPDARRTRLVMMFVGQIVVWTAALFAANWIAK